jgi:hypothetical protein
MGLRRPGTGELGFLAPLLALEKSRNQLQEAPNNQVAEGLGYRHRALGFHRDRNVKQPYR